MSNGESTTIVAGLGRSKVFMYMFGMDPLIQHDTIIALLLIIVSIVLFFALLSSLVTVEVFNLQSTLTRKC